MKRLLTATLMTAGATAALLAGAGSAQADTNTDQFVNDLSSIGLAGIDPGTAASLGQQVCPMLAQPGQDVADVAAKVADEVGRPLGPATMFTGLAIQIFCPGAVASLANGQSPIPLPGIPPLNLFGN